MFCCQKRCHGTWACGMINVGAQASDWMKPASEDICANVSHSLPGSATWQDRQTSLTTES